MFGGGDLESQLTNLLTRTVGSDVAQIKVATAGLDDLQRTHKNFGSTLLVLLHKNTSNQQISLATAIQFKNHIRKFYPLFEGGIEDSERLLIKQNLLMLMMQSPPRIQAQLSAALEEIAACDFPFDWEDLLPSLVKQLESGQQHRAVILSCLETVFKAQFEDQARTNELMKAFKYSVDLFAVLHLNITKDVMTRGGFAGNQVNVSADQLIEELKSMHSCTIIFESLNCIDLPEQYEDGMKDWFQLFALFLAWVDRSGNGEIGSKVSEIKAQICENFTLYVSKYQEEFKDLVGPAVESVWKLLLSLDQSEQNDVVVSSGIKFLSYASAQNWANNNPFSNTDALKSICEKIIIPNIALRECDLEQFEDNPQDFVQRDIEDADQDTRRKTSIDLVKNLMRFQEGTVTDILMDYIRQLMDDNANLSQIDNLKNKETCMYLVIAIAMKGGTRSQGCTILNPKVPVTEFFNMKVKTILEAPFGNGVPDFPPLRAACIKYVVFFRSQLPLREVIVPIVPHIQKHVTHSSAVVHTYAAHCIEKLIILKKPGQNGIPVPVFTPADLQGPLMQMLEPVVNLMTTQTGIPQNEYLMRCVVRVFSFLKELSIDAVKPMLTKLTDLMGQAATNPTNPHFAHNVFEGVAVLIRVAAPTGQLQAVEEQILRVCSDILSKNLTDFLPYTFQILGLLLDASNTVKDIYTQLFSMILIKDLWMSHPNVPGLVRLLKGYFGKHQHFKQLLETHLKDILDRFSFVLNNRKAEGYAFELLSAILAYLPMDMYRSQVDTLFRVVLTKLNSRKNDTKLQKHFVLSTSIFVHKYGSQTLYEILERIQAGLFLQIYRSLWIPPLDLMTTQQERKMATLALAKILLLPALQNDVQLGLESLCRLLGLVAAAKQRNRINLGGEDGNDATFEGNFSKLSNADAQDGGDYAKDIGDYKQTVKSMLQAHKTAFDQLALNNPNVQPLCTWLIQN